MSEQAPIEQAPDASIDQAPAVPGLDATQVQAFKDRYIEARRAVERDTAEGRSPLGDTRIDLGNTSDEQLGQDADNFVTEFGGSIAARIARAPNSPVEQTPDTGDTPDQAATGPTQPNRPANNGRERQQRREPTPEEIRNEIQTFNRRLADPAYAPTVAEYREMSALAQRIQVTFEKTYGQGRQRHVQQGVFYGIEGAGPESIDAHTARSFLDAVRSDRWKLSHAERAEGRRTLGINDLAEVQEVQKDRRREHKSDFLSFNEYDAYQKGPRRAPHLAPDPFNSYRNYLQRRLELDSSIRDFETAQRARGEWPSNPSRIAMQALESFVGGKIPTRPPESFTGNPEAPGRIAELGAKAAELLRNMGRTALDRGVEYRNKSRAQLRNARTRAAERTAKIAEGGRDMGRYVQAYTQEQLRFNKERFDRARYLGKVGLDHMAVAGKDLREYMQAYAQEQLKHNKERLDRARYLGKVGLGNMIVAGQVLSAEVEDQVEFKRRVRRGKATARRRAGHVKQAGKALSLELKDELNRDRPPKVKTVNTTYEDKDLGEIDWNRYFSS